MYEDKSIQELKEALRVISLEDTQKNRIKLQIRALEDEITKREFEAILMAGSIIDAFCLNINKGLVGLSYEDWEADLEYIFEVYSQRIIMDDCLVVYYDGVLTITSSIVGLAQFIKKYKLPLNIEAVKNRIKELEKAEEELKNILQRLV